MSKNQLLTWAVVLLIIMNAVTIGTILYHNYNENKATDNIVISTGPGVNMLNGKFFRQTLGFSEEQMEDFREINQGFRPYVMGLTDDVDSLKNEMFAELQKADPDTTRLNAMSKQIGELHGRLKYETYHFYLNIKKICTPAQGVELEKNFQPLFKTENTTTPNQQRRRGWNRN
jgi:hypothetical protein